MWVRAVCMYRIYGIKGRFGGFVLCLTLLRFFLVSLADSSTARGVSWRSSKPVSIRVLVKPTLRVSERPELRTVLTWLIKARERSCTDDWKSCTDDCSVSRATMTESHVL